MTSGSQMMDSIFTMSPVDHDDAAYLPSPAGDLPDQPMGVPWPPARTGSTSPMSSSFPMERISTVTMSIAGSELAVLG